jgi:hypothetical protein
MEPKDGATRNIENDSDPWTTNRKSVDIIHYDEIDWSVVGLSNAECSTRLRNIAGYAIRLGFPLTARLSGIDLQTQSDGIASNRFESGGARQSSSLLNCTRDGQRLWTFPPMFCRFGYNGFAFKIEPSTSGFRSNFAREKGEQ